MRAVLLYVAIVFFLVSCKKLNTPTVPVNDTVQNGVLLYRGSFINGPYGSVTGLAGIYTSNNQLVVALENISSSNGPDLHVYLSKERLPQNFIDLGSLQSIAGNQVYLLSGMPNLSEYRYVLIHCQRYNHLFGSAELF